MIGLLSGYLLPLLPALYAWQIHSWIVGLAVYTLVLALLVGLGWLFVLREWPFYWLRWLRWAVIALSMVVVAASAAGICSAGGDCYHVL